MTNESKIYIELGNLIAEGYKKGIQSEPDTEQIERTHKRIDELLKGIPPLSKK